MGQTSSKPDAMIDGGPSAPVLTVVGGRESRPPQPASVLRFGVFELATESGELSRNGESVKLQPQPAKLLQYLAERPGRAVSRSELQAHLWGENRFVDSEQGLNYCVKSIRQALGDRAESPMYVETIPRRGYRFRAPVEVFDGGASQELPATEAPAATRVASRALPRPSLLWAALGMVGVGIALGGIAWRYADRGAELQTPRIVVLPFENLSSMPEDGPIITGLTAELTGRLVREHGKALGVIAQTSALAFAETQTPIAEIDAELDVDLLLTGVARRSGEALRISTQLVEVASETIRWADVTERRVGESDLETWTADISAAVAEELGLQSAPQGIPAFELPAELYEVYLQGIAQSDLKTEEGRRLGLETLAEVRRRAPGFAPAHLAWARLRIRTGTPKDVLPEVMAALERAVKLDPDFAEAHLEITRLRGLYLYEWQRGAEHVRRALELRPRLAEAHIVHAMYLAAAGRVDEAIDAMHQALVIDPLSYSTSAHLAWSYFFDRQYSRAIDVSRRTLELDPTAVSAHSTIIHASILLGDRVGALAQAEELTGREFGQLEDFWRFQLAERQVGPGLHAIWQVQIGEYEAALDSLMLACQEQVGWPLPFLRTDARFDAIRQHPRFSEVLACTGLADEPASEPSS